MNPASTLRVRRLTGMLAAFWALLAIGLSFFGLLSASQGPVLPISSSFLAGVAVIQSASPEAVAAGVRPGDRVVAIDGTPILNMIQNGLPDFDLEKANDYEIEKRDGTWIHVALHPVVAQRLTRPIDTLIHLALLLVSASTLCNFLHHTASLRSASSAATAGLT